MLFAHSPAGAYVLRTDPDNNLVERDEANNAICQPISMGPGDVAAKTGPAYAC